MGRYEIRIDSDKCTGCLRCQLACSDVYTKAFNPSAARILVAFSGADCTIRLLPECDACGVCADHCFFGALTKNKRESQK